MQQKIEQEPEMAEQLEALRRAANPDYEKRCSDYDSDCKHVACPLTCWVGGTFVIEGEIAELPAADGYCPLLRSPSTRARKS